MNAIVDVQGFKTDENKFILKEIAMQCEGSNNIVVLIFKPPFPFYNLSKTERRQVCWIERNRGIFWNGGFLPYNNYKTIITSILKEKQRIFVKGEEKVLWIKEMLDECCNTRVYNIEARGCPSYQLLYKENELAGDVFSCIYHNKICALKNVICLKKWCSLNKITL